MKIAFLGTSAFADIIKNKLLESGFEVVEEVDASCDLLVVASYGQIVSKKVLKTAKHGALNVHPSLLPKYRGPSPIQTAILHGDTETGVAIMLMDEEIDHGPILAMESYDMKNKKYTYEELYKKLSEVGANLLVETIPKWTEGKILPKEQEHAKATYTEKIQREDGEVDWSHPAVYIERQVRAFYPWPGAFTFWKGKRVKILKAHVAKDKLVIDELQLEGKKPTTMREFLLGHKDFHVGP
ncbi:methionyl-tRNA formyltransferase [Patescibacteria group bacterium]|nr:methionyl-tRNA formyltransferase [Patescibacteria group bacterium]